MIHDLFDDLDVDDDDDDDYGNYRSKKTWSKMNRNEQILHCRKVLGIKKNTINPDTGEIYTNTEIIDKYTELPAKEKFKHLPKKKRAKVSAMLPEDIAAAAAKPAAKEVAKAVAKPVAEAVAAPVAAAVTKASYY